MDKYLLTSPNFTGCATALESSKGSGSTRPFAHSCPHLPDAHASTMKNFNIPVPAGRISLFQLLWVIGLDPVSWHIVTSPARSTPAHQKKLSPNLMVPSPDIKIYHGALFHFRCAQSLRESCVVDHVQPHASGRTESHLQQIQTGGCHDNHDSTAVSMGETFIKSVFGLASTTCSSQSLWGQHMYQSRLSQGSSVF